MTDWPKYKGPVAPDAIHKARSNLRQAAHRVIQRQIAQLWDDEVAACTPAASMETTFQFVSDPDLEESFGQSADSASVLVPSKELKSFTISSPDCRDTLSIVFDKPDLSAERVHVLITPASPTEATADYRFDFDLTSFAFPFTDNAAAAQWQPLRVLHDNRRATDNVAIGRSRGLVKVP